MEDSASLQEFLTLFPWPKSFLEFDRNYFILNRYEVSASTKDIWALFSDTSKLNRSLKIPSADFTENHGGRCGASKYFGLSNNWLEPPWEWIQERVLICKKVFFNGPAKKLYCIFYIEPNKDKNRLWVYYGWERRNILGSFLLKRINNYLLNSYEKVLPHALKFLDQDSSSIQSPLLRNSQHASQEMINKFSSIKETLKKAGHEHKSLETFLDYLLYGDPQDLYRIRIKKLSLEWNIPLEKLLDLALESTRLGFLKLSWDILCPHCRGPKLEAESLSDIPLDSKCELCQVSFNTNDKNSLEVVFHLNPYYRKIRKKLYCAAEAALKPHIWFQQKVPAKQKRELELKLRSGNYILRERDRSVFMRLNVSSNNPDGSIDLPEKFGERTLDIGNNIKFVLENPNPSEAIYVLENILWEEDYLRPGDILCRKDFRDIFSEDSLKSDVILQVGEQSILFTDIVQSTNIYKELGDQKAFYLVKKHFDTIFSLVKQNNGVVVKTIGDSVMASFYDPVKAITTALQIHEQMENLENSALSVRISINKGNCLAVKLNTGLDYFGSVVNEAAKLQILVNSKQTILSESILADNSVKSFLSSQEIELDEVYCNHISNNFNSIAGIIQIEQPKKVSEKQNNLS